MGPLLFRRRPLRGHCFEGPRPVTRRRDVPGDRGQKPTRAFLDGFRPADRGLNLDPSKREYILAKPVASTSQPDGGSEGWMDHLPRLPHLHPMGCLRFPGLVRARTSKKKSLHRAHLRLCAQQMQSAFNVAWVAPQASPSPTTPGSKLRSPS